MLSNQLRCCHHIRRISPLVIGNKDVLEISAIIGFSRTYTKDKGDCCKEVSQTEGKTIEPWPKSDPPPPAWRTECPQEPQPPNYDPYRIKVPNVVVPPLPPSNAKEVLGEDGRELFNNLQINFGSTYSGVQDLFSNSPIIHPDYWKDKPRKLPNRDGERGPLAQLGYHGKQKYKYAFHEPWKPLDRLTLLDQAEKEELGKVDLESVDVNEKQLI